MEPEFTNQQELVPEKDPTSQEIIQKKYAKGGGKETLYRVTIRSQIRLIGIMDSKANLIISMNTFLITGMLGFLTGSIFYFDTGEMTFIDRIPFMVLLIFSVIAITYAILSTRTDLSVRKFRAKDSPIQFTLSHQKKTPLNDYLAYMEEVLSSNDMIYENLNLDLYFLARVVSRKSHFLNIAYTMFLLGLIFSVVLFMALNIY
jgi:preprotein translocase subunit SecG